MRFHPRNRQSRHDALVRTGPNRVGQHPLADSQTRRGQFKRYAKGNMPVAALSGISTVALTFQSGGSLIVTISGDDRFTESAGGNALLISAFAALTGITLTSGSFAFSSDFTVLTVTIPINTLAAGTYAISFDYSLFANTPDPVAVNLVLT